MAVKQKKVSRKKKATKKKTVSKPLTPGSIILESNLRISSAKSLKNLLEESMEKKEVNLDASSIEKVDTSTMQLLAAYIIEADKRSININWLSPSPSVLNAAILLGLTETLKLPTGWE